MSTQDLILRFFHEIFSRVIPGAVVLALYFCNYVTHAYSKFHESTIFFGLGILGTAWFIGLSIEFLFWGFAIFLFLIIPYLENLFLPRKFPEKGDDRISFLKDIGEKHLTRSLAVICLLTIFISPTLFAEVKFYGSYTWQPLFGEIGLVLFLGTYVAVKVNDFRPYYKKHLVFRIALIISIIMLAIFAWMLLKQGLDAASSVDFPL